MDIDAAQTGDVQKLLRKDLAECRHNDQIRRKTSDLFNRVRLPDLYRLKHGYSPFFRAHFDRCLNYLSPAPLLPVRLCNRKHDLLSGCTKRVES